MKWNENWVYVQYVRNNSLIDDAVMHNEKVVSSRNSSMCLKLHIYIYSAYKYVLCIHLAYNIALLALVRKLIFSFMSWNA